MEFVVFESYCVGTFQSATLAAIFTAMMRKRRKVGSATEASSAPKDPCAVCGEGDARALVIVDLKGGERAVLCGSHDLMHRRAGSPATTIKALRSLFSDRRSTDRRGSQEDVDELAAALSAAFFRDRRSSARRSS